MWGVKFVRGRLPNIAQRSEKRVQIFHKRIYLVVVLVAVVVVGGDVTKIEQIWQSMTKVKRQERENTNIREGEGGDRVRVRVEEGDRGEKKR